MTTATERSARPGIGGGVPLEQGEDRLELDAQVLDRLGRQRAARLRLELPAAPILLDLLARALDRVFLRIEQVLHQHDQLDLAPLVHAVAVPVLGGVQEAELALPVPQHVRLQVGELTHFADRKELLHGMGRAHRQCSGLSSRSIKSATAWLGDFRWKSTSATSRAIGSSTPWRSARVTAERAVFTPSTTAARPASASSRRLPSPSSTPSWWLRDRGPVAVRIRSPIPARPANVAGSAPSATPNRVISASPRVISAARVLWPSPRPSRMPAASAMTFLSAPASSTPSTSVAEYTRKNPVEKTCCTCWATACSRAAATTAVGWRAYTSRANDGPDSTAIGASFGSTSANTHDDLGPTHRGREVTVGGKAGSECRARQEHVVQVLPIHALHHFGFTGPKRDGGEVPLTGEQVGERGAPRPSAHHGDLHPALPPDPISLTQPGPFSCETDSPSPPASARCCADACRRSAPPGPRPPSTYRAGRGPC